MSQTTCAGCKNQKPDDWVLCQKCQRVTTSRLVEIPKLHAVLASDDRLKLPERSDLERPSKSATRGAPANLHVLALLDRRTDARAVLAPWVEEAHERMGANTPVPRELAVLCARLVELMPWCAKSLPAAGDLVREVKEQHLALERVVTGERRSPRPVPCPVVLPEEGDCPGTLKIEGDGSVSCNRCGSVWPYDSWRRLGALLAQNNKGVI
jgi:hypothetical protein